MEHSSCGVQGQPGTAGNPHSGGFRDAPSGLKPAQHQRTCQIFRRCTTCAGNVQYRTGKRGDAELGRPDALRSQEYHARGSRMHKPPQLSLLIRVVNLTFTFYRIYVFDRNYSCNYTASAVRMSFTLFTPICNYRQIQCHGRKIWKYVPKIWQIPPFCGRKLLLAALCQ